MNSTALERADRAPVALFAGATPGEMIDAATDVANRFSDIVKQRRMFKRIGDRDHILIEAWQTVGTLAGVFATEAGGVTEIPWPNVEQLGAVWEQPPPAPGPEPRRPKDSPEWQEWKTADELRKRYEHHAALLDARAIGKAFGFKAAFRAVKNGQDVGWGEGRVDRTERTWVSRDDYAIASMAQTRGQSRALGAPLRFIVKLAGYETTPAEELDGTAQDAPAAAPAAPWGPVASDEQAEQAAESVAAIAGELEVDGQAFVGAMRQHFNCVPEACVTMLRGLARLLGDARARQTPAQPETAPPDPDVSAHHQPNPQDVAPEGRYQGD
jgi:hypothetical protein